MSVSIMAHPSRVGVRVVGKDVWLEFFGDTDDPEIEVCLSRIKDSVRLALEEACETCIHADTEC